MAELLVELDLVKKGFQINTHTMNNLSGNPVDLVVNDVFGIEVKSAKEMKDRSVFKVTENNFNLLEKYEIPDIKTYILKHQETREVAQL